MNTKMKTGLYWFRHDLRIDDQPALRRMANDVDKAILVYCIDPNWFEEGLYGSTHMGTHRQQFLYESLADLNQQLESFNQHLIVLVGDPVSRLGQLIIDYEIDVLAYGDHPGFYEREQIHRLKQQFPSLSTISASNNSLFEPELLPFSIDEMPDKFSPFRNKVEKHCQPVKAVNRTTILPSPVNTLQTDWAKLPLHHGSLSAFKGGERAATKQLQYYLFDQRFVSNYKQTRNGLDGWSYSSKFSAWLANGSLSVRRVYVELKRFEAEIIANESTYWLYFELLWREFFWWLQRKHDAKWFVMGGIQNKLVSVKTPDNRFTQWKNGETNNPHINACMRQLNSTGYMSNRGRQWAASYLVNELEQDWRYGAAYFEQQLIDYDVGANWGNWQYLAGVGSDPRGQRHFNIEKQVSMYDPDGEFTDVWAG